MKRRQFIHYLQVGVWSAIATAGLSEWQTARAQSVDGLSVRWFGHTCFSFSGGGKRILVNPFRSIGCTSGYDEPSIDADLVLVSSLLLDEGNLEGLPEDQKLLFEAGAYQLGDLRFEGIKTDHDRNGGRRFGTNVVWGWTQAGLKILHLGGAAAPITFEQQILMGQPDVLFLPVGGGPKAYGPDEAAATLELLNPKIVVPTHYFTSAADPATCDLEPLDAFLDLIPEVQVRRVGSSATIAPRDLPETGTIVYVMDDRL
ncbi:MBL fold metallo-hydrolase [Oscillatoriales cyanobacterium LEGE 11467]|uniref:MBL fold metallo-hydrolase n=1 Tax=Zarconia navalis LEGE 11467 TaxID=1828826 RepID=A0A928Z9S0_9CYAN|nr:MBL fold metallo-hydrolase [Zarconia navalis]MBE9041963.1 MBL fold metallo-hydrolase [Zarconia navalis LEGE 11467]